MSCDNDVKCASVRAMYKVEYAVAVKLVKLKSLWATKEAVLI